jgi:hypothetical protein
MSTAFKKYDRVVVYINGQLMAEEATVSMKFISGLSKVKTVVKGFAGVCKGSEEVDISMSSAIPVDGFEFMPASLPQGTVINVAAYTASKTYSADAIVMGYDISHSTDDHAKISLDIAGQYQDWA